MMPFQLPNWIARWVRRESCTRCGRRYQSADLRGFSAWSGDRSRGPHCSIQVKCPQCGQVLIIVSDKAMNFRKMVARSHRDYQQADRQRLARQRRVPPPRPSAAGPDGRPTLTGREVEDVRRLLDQSQTHDDFLRSLGLSQEEIDRYKQSNGPGAGGDET